MQLQPGWGWLLAQRSEEPADLVAGQRDQLVLASAAGVRLGGGQDGQEGVGEQGQDGPAVPGGPAADLVLGQGGEFLAGGEPIFNRPLLMPLKLDRSPTRCPEPGRY